MLEDIIWWWSRTKKTNSNENKNYDGDDHNAGIRSGRRFSFRRRRRNTNIHMILKQSLVQASMGGDDNDDNERRNIDVVNGNSGTTSSGGRTSRIVVVSFDQWMEMLDSRGKRLWTIRHELFEGDEKRRSNKQHKLPSLKMSRLRLRLLKILRRQPLQQPTILVITSPTVFNRFEQEFGMDKPHAGSNVTTSTTGCPVTTNHPSLLPLTRCTRQDWIDQRPKVQWGLQYVAQRSQQLLLPTGVMDLQQQQQQSSLSLSSLHDEIFDHTTLLSESTAAATTTTTTTTATIDLKSIVHDTTCRWIIALFCCPSDPIVTMYDDNKQEKKKTTKTHILEQRKIRNLQDVFDSYWNFIRRPRNDLRSSNQNDDNINNRTELKILEQQILKLLRLQVDDLLHHHYDHFQKDQQDSENGDNDERDQEDDKSRPSSSSLSTPRPILLELALSFGLKKKVIRQDGTGTEVIAVAVEKNNNPSSTSSSLEEATRTIVAMNALNAMIAAADACQSIVFWTLWNLQARPQLWKKCRHQCQCQRQPHHYHNCDDNDNEDRTLQDDLMELGILKQQATKGMKVNWFQSSNVSNQSSHRLSLLGRAIMETVRFYPPVWTLPRQIPNEYVQPSQRRPVFVKLDVIAVNQAYHPEDWNPIRCCDDDCNTNNGENVDDTADCLNKDNETHRKGTHEAAKKSSQQHPHSYRQKESSSSSSPSSCYIASFGLGKRHCPAGTASLQAAYLIVRHYLQRWDTLKEVDDGKSFRSIYLGPTLCLDDYNDDDDHHRHWFQVISMPVNIK